MSVLYQKNYTKMKFQRVYANIYTKYS